MTDQQIIIKVNEWLNDMSSDMAIFRDYEWVIARDPDLRYILLDVYVDVVKFWALVVPYLRRKHNCKNP